MILILAGMLIGAAVGVARAWMKGGNAYDMAQYGAVHALIFGLIGVFAGVVILRGA